MTRRRPPPDSEHAELAGPLVQPQRVAFSKHGMVATAHYRATESAVRVLAEGGNAIDAAVTAAFSLGVCEPQASGLGGQTMMLLHTAEPRRTIAIDGSSRAPNRATPESLTEADRRRGYPSTTVPSSPAVLAYVLERYGSLSLARILEPAHELAEDGFEISELQRALLKRERRALRAGNAGSLLLREGSRLPPVEFRLRQPSLAATLRRLAREGIEDFYTGGIARRIHDDMELNGGLLRDDDLAQVPWPIERRPLGTRFQGMRVVTFPPPGAGRALLEMLHILEAVPEARWDPDVPLGAVTLARVMRFAALDRRDRPFDPEFYPQVEERRMLDRGHARRLARQVTRRVRTRGETTHLSVMDGLGNAVALTQSIERVFGACVATPDLGFLYNDYMSAFEYEDIGHPYYLRPNAVPWASVAPTLVFRGRKPWLVLGSPGSERIVTTILQVLLRLRVSSPFEAVMAPRLHCGVDGTVSLEAPRFRDDIPRALEQSGFTVRRRDAFSFYLGCVQLVRRERTGFTGVADPRRDGSAGGPAG